MPGESYRMKHINSYILKIETLASALRITGQQPGKLGVTNTSRRFSYSMKPMKRVMMIVMAFTLFFAVTVPDFADARRGGGFKSGSRGFTTTPKKSTTDNVKKSDSTKSNTNGTAANANRGFFSGGSLMKGLMIGGIAGFLFGGMFAGMGAFGNIIGFLINMLAIYFVITLIMSFFKRRQERRRLEERDGRY